MKRNSKLFTAFNGNAADLRNELIEHFKLRVHLGNSQSNGTTWNDGFDAGKGAGYREVVHFLKKLVINDDEHADVTVSDEVSP